MAGLDSSVIEKAAVLLRRGELVAFPTETVYGLGANALSGEAVARIFEAKGRPRFNPLIVHLKDIEAVKALCLFPESARILAQAFWPGPLTLVLQRKDDCAVSELVSAGLSTLAVRVPGHAMAHALLCAADVPVAAPSANRSGHVSATCASHVRADIGDRIDLVLDGGPTSLGLESTVVSVESGGTGGGRHGLGDDDVVILRAGSVTAGALEEVLGRPIERRFDVVGATARSPGQLESHYAPRAELRLNATTVLPGEVLLAFGPDVPAHEGACLNLSAAGNLVEAAANLFSMLRELDALEAKSICVMPVPLEGLGEAINDRLRRASAPRP